MRKSKLNRFITLIIALLLGSSAALLSFTQILSIPDQTFTNWFYDHTVAMLRSTDKRITVIAIDKASERIYGQYPTWSRQLLADAILSLSKDNAAVIGLDLNLSEPASDSAGDAALVKACEAADNVVAIASVEYLTPLEDADQKPLPWNAARSNTKDMGPTADTDSDIPMDMNPAEASTNWEEQEIACITLPYDALLSSVTLGIANATQQSADGFVRNAALMIEYNDTIYDSFAAAVYKTFHDYYGTDYNLPDLDSELFGFNAFDAKNSCNVISFADFISGNYDASLITDNIVLIGEYEESISTALQNFIQPNQAQQEVMLQTSIIQALLNENTIRNVPNWFQSAFVFILITVFYLIIASRKTWVTILSCFLLSQFVVFTGFLVNMQGYRLQLLVSFIFLVATLVVALTHRNILNIIERKLMERTLKMYVEPRVVEHLSEKMPHELSHLSERRHIAILFVDIRGFTSLSESLEPEQVVEILNEYLTLVANAIQHWGGTLDKFIGDAAMAFFNAPKDQDDYIFHAVCTAYEITKSADHLRDKYEALYGKPVTFGIGINCGEAIVGNIGSFNRIDYTAIGDSVNTASRLESNAKAGQILISEAVYHAVKDRIDATYIGALSLKGKSKTVETYQVDRITSLPDSAFRRKGFLNEAFILYSQIRTNK